MARPPHIHLLTYHDKDLAEFRIALESYSLPANHTISYHSGLLRNLPSSVKFDVAVSPANSHGCMDGGFDDALSKEFSPKGNYLGLTRVVQKHLYQEWRGFAPPGTCTLVPFNFEGQSADEKSEGDQRAAAANPRGCRIIAVCPTMRVPQDVRWDREVVYECMWSLLCAVDKWNRNCKQEDRIESLLMTPFATATGGVSAQKWACQVLLAMQHFHEACENEAKWGALEPRAILDLGKETAATYNM